MDKAVKISILVTTYNLKPYISQALKSVLGQETDYPFEVLVGDDGSDDGTIELVRKWAEWDPRVTLIVQDRPAGPQNKVLRAAANRLSLLKRAQGEYCSFLDGDDHYTDCQRLQRMTDILEKEENRDCIMCAHNLRMDWPDGSYSRLCRAKREQKLSVQRYWKLMFLQANALLFRNIYREHKPEGALAACFDDNNITWWLFQYGKMYYLPECMGAYRQLESSSWNEMDEIQHSALNLLGYGVELSVAPDLKKLSAIRHYPDLAALYEQRGKFSPEDLSPFYETAEQLGLEETLRLYRMGELPEQEQEKLGKEIMRLKLEYGKARLARGIRKGLGRY